MAPNGIKWDDTNDRRLLLAMIRSSGSKFDWKDIASRFGEGVTANAVTKRWRKILKDVEGGTGGGSPDKEDEEEDESPRKKKRAKTSHKVEGEDGEGGEVKVEEG